MFVLLLAATLSEEPVIIPYPVKITSSDSYWELIDKTNIFYNKDIKNAKEVAQYCSEFLSKGTGFTLPVTTTKSNGIQFEKSSETLKDEEYHLKVDSNGVLITASTRKGLYYGFVTLLQLMPPEIYNQSAKSVKWNVQYVDIVDYPRFKWRGLLFDCCRHFFPMDVLKRAIKFISFHKLNVFHWHLTEDQGWRIEIKKYPLLTQIGSLRKQSPKMWDRGHGDGIPYGPFFYSQDEVKELIEYARLHGVTIVPEIEMPGHAMAALAGYPHLSCTGGPFEVSCEWGVRSDIYCGGKDEALEFNKDVLNEVIGLFDSEYIHVGGDEAFKDRWKVCPLCQGRIKSLGLANEDALQSWFTRQICDHINSKGRKLIGWDEIIDGGDMPKGTAVMLQHGTAKALEKGHEIVVTPNAHCYFDYGQTTKDDKYEYLCCLVTLNNAYAWDPQAGIAEDKKHLVMGIHATLWSECIWAEEDLQWKHYPRGLALAEVSWSQQEHKNWNRFLAGWTGVHQKRLAYLNINFAPFTDSIRNVITSAPKEYKKQIWSVSQDVEQSGRYQGIFVSRKGDLKVRNIDIFVDGKLWVRQYDEGVAKSNNGFSFDFFLPVDAVNKDVYVQAEISSDSHEIDAELYVYPDNK